MISAFSPFSAFVPLRNPGLAVGFRLNSIFNGVDGAWYEVKDIATLFKDAEGTQPVTIGDPVALLRDKSINGNHATQSISANRPVLTRTVSGGRRNLLTFTEDFTDSVWIVGERTQVTQDYGSTPTGSTTTRVQMPVGLGTYIWQTLYLDAGDYTVSFYVKGVAGQKLRVGLIPTAIALDSGNSSDFTLDGTWQTFQVTKTLTENPQWVFAIDGFDSNQSFDAEIAELQVESGTQKTNYQKVNSQYDITEKGKREIYCLYSDEIDDSLGVTFDDFGTDATVIYTTLDEVNTLQNQTISGAYTLPISNLTALVVLESGLSDKRLFDVKSHLLKLIGKSGDVIPLAALITQDGQPLVTQDGNYLIAEAA